MQRAVTDKTQPRRGLKALAALAVVGVAAGLWSLTEVAQASRANLPKKAPPGMTRVQEGTFLMGCNAAADRDCAPDEYPAREVFLHSFAIDTYEVPINHYKSCVDAGACEAPIKFDMDHNVHYQCNWGRADRSRHPVNCVTWGQAWTFCNWAYKRLPTEAEWEKAARWIDARVYPWGDTPAPTCDQAVMNDPKFGGSGCGHKGASATHLSHDASPYGVVDLSGNLREWVWDVYQANYYSVGPATDPTGPTRIKGVAGDAPPNRVVRGGHYDDTAGWRLRSSKRDFYQPNYTHPTLGFRCARGLQ
jgi:sulfatase modifying factor 1